MAEELDLLKKALEASPENWQTRRFLIEQLLERGELKEASEILAQAPEIPDRENDQLLAAKVAGLSDPEEGHRLIDVVLEKNAASADAHALKAAFYRKTGATAKAESHSKVAQVLNPGVQVEGLLPSINGSQDPAAGVDLPTPVPAAPSGLTAARPVLVEADDEDEDEGPVAQAVMVDDEAADEKSQEAPAAVEKTAAEKPAEARAETAASPEAKGSQPVVARKLTPPGAKEETLEIMPIGESGKVAVAATEDEHEHGERHGERAFIVTEGEAVHAAQKERDTTQKVSALTVAVLVHVVIALALTAYVISERRESPPQIIATSVTTTEDTDIESTSVTKMQRKAASAVDKTTAVVTANAISNFSLPEVTQVSNDFAMVSLTSNGTEGLGMSMEGLGDVSNMTSIPAAMRSRCSMSQRMKRLRESGGEERAEAAVRNALDYLVKSQNKDGSWGRDFPVAMTGLALLAYLGHCETPESPKYGETVVNAALYLMDKGMKNDGRMETPGKGNHPAYEHAIATYALCELFTMSKESGREIPRLDSLLRKSVGIIVDGQNAKGGWVYGYKGDTNSDLSVSGWQIQALKAAYNTGERFSGVDSALDKAVEYVKTVQDGEGAFKYRPSEDKGKPTLTGAGVLAMQMWNEGDSPEARKGLEYLDKAYKSPTPGSNYYSPYYNTQAYFLEGGKLWETYNSKFQKLLLDAQNPDGSWQKGSSSSQAKNDHVIYSTCLATLMLEVYYRYLPTTDKVRGLKTR